MTTAPTTQEMAALGWDTIERIIIGAACQLQAINQGLGESSPFLEAIQIRTDVSSTSQSASQSLTYPLNGNEATMLTELEALEALGWKGDNLAVIKEILSDSTVSLPATVTEIALTKDRQTPVNTAKFVGQFTFYLDDALPDGGQFLGNLLEYTTGPFGTFTPASASPVHTPALPTIPPAVNSLESLLCWACLVLNASSSAAGQFVQVSPFYATDRISISVSLPLDWEALSATGWHLVASVPRLVSEYVEIDPDNVAGALPSTIPSGQFWLDPVENLTQLKSLSATIGANCYVSSKGAIYGLIPALPTGQSVDNDLYVEPFTQSNTEVWAKGAGGSAGGAGVSDFNDLTNLPAGDYYRDLLSALTGANRLDASAIKNLPSSGTPGAQGPAGQNGSGIVNGLLTLPHTTTPSAPSSGNTVIYAKSDGQIYKRAAGGNEEAIGTGGTSGGREVLTADRIYYVRTDGNDTNTGLTNTAGGAFATIQRAIDTAAGLDCSTYSVTIQLADGDYSAQPTVILKDWIGASGALAIKGNPTNKKLVKTPGFSATSIKKNPLLENVWIFPPGVFGVDSISSEIQLKNCSISSGVDQYGLSVTDNSYLRILESLEFDTSTKTSTYNYILVARNSSVNAAFCNLSKVGSGTTQDIDFAATELAFLQLAYTTGSSFSIASRNRSLVRLANLSYMSS